MGRKPPSIDKSQLAIPVVARKRDSDHLRWLRQQKCCVPGCSNVGSEAHHILSSPEPKSRGMKPSDCWAIPLCPEHHRGSDSPHGRGDERAWAKSHAMNAILLAQYFWSQSIATRTLMGKRHC